MTSFRTEIKIAPSRCAIHHADSMITLGSCFSDSIGNKLSENKFVTYINPLGTIYHPVGIAQSILNAWNGTINQNHFVVHQDRWYHFDFHSRFSGATKEELENKLETALTRMKASLLQANRMMVTFGTSWGYVLKKSKELAVNCHQISGKEFEKKFYSIEESAEIFNRVYTLLEKVNPSLQWIFTVSPVRHIRDGLEGNAVSKAALRLLCHQLQKENAFYFPAYEIMMDDLRDYRFYSRDKIHPSEEAIDYIWGKFSEQYFNQETRNLLSQWTKVRKSLQHKPFHPSGKPYKNFLRQIREELLLLQTKIDVKEELKRIEENILLLK